MLCYIHFIDLKNIIYSVCAHKNKINDWLNKNIYVDIQIGIYYIP